MPHSVCVLALAPHLLLAQQIQAALHAYSLHFAATPADIQPDVGLLLLDATVPDAIQQVMYLREQHHLAHLPLLALVEPDTPHVNALVSAGATDCLPLSMMDALLPTRVRLLMQSLTDAAATRQAEVGRERALLHAILNAIRDGVIYEDANGQPEYINRALVELTGYDLTDWLSLQAEIAPPDETDEDRQKRRARARRSLDQRGYWSEDLLVRRKDGSTFHASIIQSDVRRPGSTTSLGTVTVLRNISQIKELEKQKARFITSASHELRTPIANIKTRLYLMRRQPQRFNEHIEVAQSVVNWMQKLVEDMFDMARFERGAIELEMETVDLSQFVAQVLRYQQPEAEQQGIRLMYSGSMTPLPAQIDPNRMTQVLSNLINNALRYTPRDGQIVVALHVTNGPKTNREVALSVEDSGPGIAPEHLPYVFQAFYRADDSSQGTGLGLSISHEIVRRHGGQMTVESQLGQGSRFNIILPLNQVESG